MAYNFKNEEDVQDYLKNIGTEYRFSCFKEKNAEGISFRYLVFSNRLYVFEKSFVNKCFTQATCVLHVKA